MCLTSPPDTETTFSSRSRHCLYLWKLACRPICKFQPLRWFIRFRTFVFEITHFVGQLFNMYFSPVPLKTKRHEPGTSKFICYWRKENNLLVSVNGTWKFRKDIWKNITIKASVCSLDSLSKAFSRSNILGTRQCLNRSSTGQIIKYVWAFSEMKTFNERKEFWKGLEWKIKLPLKRHSTLIRTSSQAIYYLDAVARTYHIFIPNDHVDISEVRTRLTFCWSAARVAFTAMNLAFDVRMSRSFTMEKRVVTASFSTVMRFLFQSRIYSWKAFVSNVFPVLRVDLKRISKKQGKML